MRLGNRLTRAWDRKSTAPAFRKRTLSSFRPPGGGDGGVAVVRQAGGFADARYVAGFELEAWLLDHAGRPSPVNAPYLRALNDPLVVPELSRFNVELNAPPVEMGAGVLAALEDPCWAPGTNASAWRTAWTPCWR
jgi:hypothetical protein